MTAASWPTAFDAVMAFDGVKDDDAPGEQFHTQYGITPATWVLAVRASIVANKPQSQCTWDDAEAILFHCYWDACRCDRLPTGVDLIVFAHAMLAGNEPAIEALQSCVNADVDGIIGPQTMVFTNRAYNTLGPLEMCRQLVTENLGRLSQLAKWAEYENGWTNRENAMLAAAQKLIGGQT